MALIFRGLNIMIKLSLKGALISCAFILITTNAAQANPPDPGCLNEADDIVRQSDVTHLWQNYYFNYYPDPLADSYAESDALRDLCRAWLAPPRNLYQRKYGPTNKKCQLYKPRPITTNLGDDYSGVPGSNPATLWFTGCARLNEEVLDPVQPRLSPRVPSVSFEPK